jgi:hypothetical protein
MCELASPDGAAVKNMKKFPRWPLTDERNFGAKRFIAARPIFVERIRRGKRPVVPPWERLPALADQVKPMQGEML